LATARAGLAASLAKHCSAAGFPLYGGEDWMTLYARGAAPGVFVDRRPPRQRVYLLRKPRIPFVIVETHHALDLDENARWQEPRTLDAFGAALAVALDEALRTR
jgi:N-acetylmuramoyl-L-alanine amidase